jgi:hypothetical protein
MQSSDALAAGKTLKQFKHAMHQGAREHRVYHPAESFSFD